MLASPPAAGIEALPFTKTSAKLSVSVPSTAVPTVILEYASTVSLKSILNLAPAIEAVTSTLVLFLTTAV